MTSGNELAAAAFGLASALSWGGGDFSGGLASRRAPVMGVLAVGYATGVALLATLALLRGDPLPPAGAVAWGAAAGLAGLVGLGALYRGLATGRMAVVAPVSAVLSAAIPVLFAALTAGAPGAARLAGFALALGGIWLVARHGDGTAGPAADGAARPSGLGLAVVAGAGFGAFFVLVARAGEGGAFWPLAAARATSLLAVIALALVLRRAAAWVPPAASLPLVLLAGVLDTAGNAFFVLAAQAGRLDVAAVLASMYPASTVALAALLLRERIARLQGAGIAAVLAAIALIVR
jgi:drug/metabolite transporter (DMT)-like permease